LAICSLLVYSRLILGLKSFLPRATLPPQEELQMAHMSHEEALEKKLAERLVLGELTDPEILEFEEHYADCSVCSSSVPFAQIFVANLTALLRERQRSSRQESGDLPELDDFGPEPEAEL